MLSMGDGFTYKAYRLLLPGQSLARQLTLARHHGGAGDRHDRSFRPGQEGGFNEELGPQYERLRADGFADWRLTVEGSVERPGTCSLADLKRLALRTQITSHTCEEGWSAIMQWTGAPLRAVLEAAGIQPEREIREVLRLRRVRSTAST